MNYKQKLIDFNSTEKYRSEMSFLAKLIGHDHGFILDYGCGIGTAVQYISQQTGSIVRGYDVKHYEEVKSNWFLEQPPNDMYSHIYFMHSLAHIDNVGQVLVKLRENLLPAGRITVITPNGDWIKEIGDTRSDPTVVEHFRAITLIRLFESSGYRVIRQGQFGKCVRGINERLFIQVCRDSL